MRFLSNKEKREILNYILNNLGIVLDLNENPKKLQFIEENNIIFMNNIPVLIKTEYGYIPTLLLLNMAKDINIPYVIVDKGAVKHILNGADVYRPGIIEASNDLGKNKPTIIVSEDKKLLGVGIALVNFEEFAKMSKGKVIKTIHWYGDKIFLQIYNKDQIS